MELKDPEGERQGANEQEAGARHRELQPGDQRQQNLAIQ